MPELVQSLLRAISNHQPGYGGFFWQSNQADDSSKVTSCCTSSRSVSSL